MNYIRIGDTIPDFSLKDLDGRIYETAKLRGKMQLVLIFYPPDGTNGCKNIECKFHDITEYFDRDSFLILGICGASEEILKASPRLQDLKFPIICDQDFKLRKLFGAPVLRLGKYNGLLKQAFGLNPGRLTFVTDRDGKVIYKTQSQDGLKCQADEALKINFILRNTMVRNTTVSKI